MAVAWPVTEGAVLLLQPTETFAGQIIIGGRLSFLVMVCIHEDVLPQLSDAIHLRRMVESQGVPDLVSENVTIILA